MAYLRGTLRNMRFFSWSRLLPALAARPGWKRVGREWHGPCPLTNKGQDTCWARAADRIPDGVLFGCRNCQPFTDDDRRLHVEALSIDAVVVVDSPGLDARREALPLQVSGLVRSVWTAGISVERTPAAVYLRERRGCWGSGPLPPSVRWLPSGSPPYAAVRPVPPARAAGLLLYGFRGLNDRVVASVQLEAITRSSDRLPWPPTGAPRVSVAGSRFDAGRQRFEVLSSPSDRLFLVEGPLSALVAPAVFPELLDDWSVVGVAGWGGFKRAAVGAARTVRICPDGDADGQRAVSKLAEDLLACGFEVLVDQIPVGADLLDVHRWGGTMCPPGKLQVGVASVLSSRSVSHEAPC